jgi:sporulation protein YlmC with PRC-barrel domain
MVGRWMMNTSSIIGKEVLDKNANRVGTVADIDITLPQGTINYLWVRIGMIKRIPVPLDNVDKFGDKVILKITKDELEKSAVSPT